MKTPSPYAHIFTALAEDKDAKFESRRCDKSTEWKDTLTHSILYQLSSVESGNYDGPAYEFRVKPDTIMIGNREVPKPRTEADWETDKLLTIGWKSFWFDTVEDCDAAADAICAVLEGRE